RTLRVRGEYRHAPLQRCRAARRTFRRLVTADQHLELVCAFLTGVLVKGHQCTLSSAACLSIVPSTLTISGSNWLPLQRSISETARVGSIAGRWMCGCVIESYESATARIRAPTGMSSPFSRCG